MPFIQKDLPQYHYADDDGLIGLRGAMYYFQNIVHRYNLHFLFQLYLQILLLILERYL